MSVGTRPITRSITRGITRPAVDIGPIPALWIPFDDAGAGAVSLAIKRGQGPLTFTRATGATTILSNRLVGNVSSGVARAYYSPAGVYLGYLSEQQSTNVCRQAENFGTTWAAIGTPTRTAAAKTCGTVALDLLSDADAATLDGYSQNVTFTGNAVKAFSVFFAQGTAASSIIRLRDTTGSADRLLAAITWSVGVPTITMTTGTLLGFDALGNGVFRARFATSAVTAANTNQVQIYPASTAALTVADVGNAYFGGVQCEDNTFPTTYIPTTTATVTRNADVLTLPSTGNASATQGTFYAEINQQQLDTTANAYLSDFLGSRPPAFVTATTGALALADGGATRTGPVAAAGATHKAVTTWDATVPASFVYVDGANNGALGFDGSMDLGATIFIAGNAGSTQRLNGAIRNYRIWLYALSAARVAILS